MFIKYLKIKNIPGVEDMELSFTNKINASFSKGGIGRSACVKAMKNYFGIADFSSSLGSSFSSAISSAASPPGSSSASGGGFSGGGGGGGGGGGW